MTEKIMQCCYTNAVKQAGGQVSSGWQAVVVSEGLPSDAYAACVSLQNANASLQSHALDEGGNVLNLFEIAGDSSYAYVSRTQFGLTDRLGRPNLFSHAYIFPWTPEVLSDPNIFLTLTRDNFARDEETAARPRRSLTRSKPFTLDTALERARLTGEGYLTLIRCVWAQYSERGAQPLYIQYDGSEEQMLALLYCVYMGLPYSLRRGLSAASSATSSSKSYHLVFSVDAASRGCYLVPQTGENDILTPRALRRMARCGFVDYAAAHFRELDTDAYFQRLEKLAAELGDPSASDELILRISHQLIEDVPLSGLPGEEVAGRLSDALRSRSYGSHRMEEYISRLLDEVCRRSLALTPASEANLAQRLASPATRRLALAGERYNIYRLGSMPPEEAVEFLAGLPQSAFARYRQRLKQSGAGLRILDAYYSTCPLAGKAPHWAMLEELRREVADLPGSYRTRDAIDAAAWTLYREELNQPGKAREAYRSLMGLMEGLLSPDRLADCGEMARQAYWEPVSPQSFDYERAEEYRAMEADIPLCGQFLELCLALDACAAGEEAEFLRRVGRFAAAHYPNGKVPDTAVPSARVRAEARRVSPDPDRLSRWIPLALLPEVGPVLEEVFSLRDALSRRAYGEFTEIYRKVMDALLQSGRGRAVLAGALVEECRLADQPGTWVPFDLWLLLGLALYPADVFYIFEKVDPCVVRLEEAHGAVKSKLLFDPPYLEQARAYAQGKGAAPKLVHKLLNERKAEERRARREADGSLLDRSRALLSQLGKSREK